MNQTVKKSARMRRLDTLGNKINKLTKINLRQNPRSAQYKRNSKLIANLTNNYNKIANEIYKGESKKITPLTESQEKEARFAIEDDYMSRAARAGYHEGVWDPETQKNKYASNIDAVGNTYDMWSNPQGRKTILNNPVIDFFEYLTYLGLGKKAIVALIKNPKLVVELPVDIKNKVVTAYKKYTNATSNKKKGPNTMSKKGKIAGNVLKKIKFSNVLSDSMYTVIKGMPKHQADAVKRLMKNGTIPLKAGSNEFKDSAVKKAIKDFKIDKLKRGDPWKKHLERHNLGPIEPKRTTPVEITKNPPRVKITTNKPKNDSTSSSTTKGVKKDDKTSTTSTSSSTTKGVKKDDKKVASPPKTSTASPPIVSPGGKILIAAGLSGAAVAALTDKEVQRYVKELGKGVDITRIAKDIWDYPQTRKGKDSKTDSETVSDKQKAHKPKRKYKHFSSDHGPEVKKVAERTTSSTTSQPPKKSGTSVNKKDPPKPRPTKQSEIDLGRVTPNKPDDSTVPVKTKTKTKTRTTSSNGSGKKPYTTTEVNVGDMKPTEDPKKKKGKRRQRKKTIDTPWGKLTIDSTDKGMSKFLGTEAEIKEQEEMEEMNYRKGGMPRRKAFGKGGMYKSPKKTYGMRHGGFTSRGKMS